jgi:hypothetical protein
MVCASLSQRAGKERVTAVGPDPPREPAIEIGAHGCGSARATIGSSRLSLPAAKQALGDLSGWRYDPSLPELARHERMRQVAGALGGGSKKSKSVAHRKSRHSLHTY